jgi:hypothetical protein
MRMMGMVVEPLSYREDIFTVFGKNVHSVLVNVLVVKKLMDTGIAQTLKHPGDMGIADAIQLILQRRERLR